MLSRAQHHRDLLAVHAPEELDELGYPGPMPSQFLWVEPVRALLVPVASDEAVLAGMKQLRQHGV